MTLARSEDWDSLPELESAVWQASRCPNSDAPVLLVAGDVYLLLMISILHDFIFKNPRDYGAAHIYIYIHTHSYMYTSVCWHIHTYIYIYTHMYACRPLVSPAGDAETPSGRLAAGFVCII